ncbi:hypothetical protein PHLCEN_2v585 [Hermanssonia centrifuga]|uniref:Uncharacterized protein n=1 Tax=Hermanssonia centrifuga TaxID=98765 RepID=A0A2R6S5S3_9APHY|nr:hypothetical protein PHLCEN_2v585 [Hermanssonia centrifuga]
MSSYEDELPFGWVRQIDERTNHAFWVSALRLVLQLTVVISINQVDTKAKPPRAIWIHPYEDEQFLNEHPEVRDRLAKPDNGGSSQESPPPYSPRRHSYSGSSNFRHSSADIRNSNSQPMTPPAMNSSGSQQKHRGFFGKMKDKAIGTKEEREEAKRQEALAYAPPMGSPFGSGYGYSNYGARRRQGGFGGGIGMPILGGLAGGLILGDLLDGGFGGGGFDGGFGGGIF